jgi:DNA-binding NtrC family response regulator
MKPRHSGDRDQVEEHSSLVQSVANGRRPKGVILVVEDDEAMREALCDIFSLLNYNVLHAESGQEALEIFQREPIDLVVSDLMMPEMDGERLYQELCEIKPGVKMILLTGLPMEDKREDLIRAGVFAWIQKPLDIDVITQTIMDALKPSSSEA